MVTLLVKVLVKISLFFNNLEKKYLKKYGFVCHNDNLCFELIDTCECEQKNIFRQIQKKIGNCIYRLERKVR